MQVTALPRIIFDISQDWVDAGVGEELLQLSQGSPSKQRSQSLRWEQEVTLHLGWCPWCRQGNYLQGVLTEESSVSWKHIRRS